MQHRLTPDKWIDDYADYLFAFASYRISNKEQAEDLVQDTFLSAYKNVDQFKGNANEKTWLTSILKNKIIDWYRKNARTSKVIVSESDLHYFFDEEENSHWTNQAAPREMSLSGLDHLQQIETNKMVDQCLESLPPVWNQICKMKWIDEEKTELICKTFDITPSNFWVIMHRAKLQLRNCIAKKIES